MPLKIPLASQPLFAGINFSLSQPVAQPCKALFDRYDEEHPSDATRCQGIVAVSGAVCWISKLSIDADGRAVEDGFRDGEELDSGSGQDDTSIHFSDGTALDSEGCPYNVLPLGEFRAQTGLKLGDVGVIAYKGVLTAVMAGDLGPVHKLGEASIRVHNRLRPAAPDPCSHRDEEGRCIIVRNASIESDVVTLMFRNSGAAILPTLTLANAQQHIEDVAFERFRAIGGFVPGGTLS